MLPIPELAKMFHYGSQPYALLYRAAPPTEASIATISAKLGIRLPRELLEFAGLCPSYGVWFASLGEDYENGIHILRLHEAFHHPGETEQLPEWLVMFNHGHDGDCDCFDIRSQTTKGEYPLVYYSVSESSNPPPPSAPVILAPTIHEYLEKWSIRMKEKYDKSLQKKREPNQPAQTTPGLRPSVSDL